jgi:hypothetical protein
MKRLATRVYTFRELMKRLDSDVFYVVESEEEPDQHFTFVPIQYKGKWI